MVREIILHQAGESLTATLPQDIAERMHVCAGDKVFAVETELGVLLTRFEPGFDEAIHAFDEVRRQYRNTLKKLAE